MQTYTNCCRHIVHAGPSGDEEILGWGPDLDAEVGGGSSLNQGQRGCVEGAGDRVQLVPPPPDDTRPPQRRGDP